MIKQMKRRAGRLVLLFFFLWQSGTRHLTFVLSNLLDIFSYLLRLFVSRHLFINVAFSPSSSPTVIQNDKLEKVVDHRLFKLGAPSSKWHIFAPFLNKRRTLLASPPQSRPKASQKSGQPLELIHVTLTFLSLLFSLSFLSISSHCLSSRVLSDPLFPFILLIQMLLLLPVGAGRTT